MRGPQRPLLVPLVLDGTDAVLQGVVEHGVQHQLRVLALDVVVEHFFHQLRGFDAVDRAAFQREELVFGGEHGEVVGEQAVVDRVGERQDELDVVWPARAAGDPIGFRDVDKRAHAAVGLLPLVPAAGQHGLGHLHQAARVFD